MSRKFSIGGPFLNLRLGELVEEIVDDIMFQNFFGDDLEPVSLLAF